VITPLFKPVPHVKPRAGLGRGKPLRARNPERKEAMYERNFSGGTGPGHDEFIRGLPCLVFGCNRWPIEAAHTVTRKRGGCGSSWRQQVPLCRKHHPVQEGRTDEFGREVGLDLNALAEVLVVADPGVPVPEQLEAWRRLAAYDEASRLGALQRGYDLTGYHIQPPQVAQETFNA
jgi:hypothetical protein